MGPVDLICKVTLSVIKALLGIAETFRLFMDFQFGVFDTLLVRCEVQLMILELGPEDTVLGFRLFRLD